MAFTLPSSLLLLRSFSSKNPIFHSRITYLVRATRALWFSNVGGNGEINHFSTSQSSSSPSPLQHSEADLPNLSSDPKTSLSARMSFVFDQIDAMERERSEKDEALQRIRSWRDSRKKKIEEESSRLGNSESVDTRLSSETEAVERKREESLVTKKEVEVVHPWPEWIELMERLVQQNYFDHRRTDEEKMMQDLSIDVSGFAEEGCDFTRDWTTVRTACLNFARDRFDILKSLSRQDLQILVGYGCPSSDKKVVFSAKMLRKHVHLDEGDVCSSCSLRSSCEKAYLLSRKEDEARTLDVMRVLLTFGFDPINVSVENKSLLKLKSVRTVVRKLLHEVVKLSAVPIDPNLPPPVIKKPLPKIKQPPPPPKKRVGRDDIEMKKGDWLCPKCDFMNFAKNTVCLQCDAKRPKRQLLPGEWECPECNFLNYRRNMACFHCDHKRPPDEFMENQLRSRPSGLKSRLEKVADMPGVSNAWNFDFDDNESDGADVAAFEYADPPRIAQDFSMENHAQMESTRGAFEDYSFENSQVTRANGRDKYSNLNQRKSGAGFDDFDDEEDDDIDSYEIDISHGNPIQKASSKDFSQSEGFSESEDFDSSDQHLNAHQGIASSHHKLARAMPVRGDFSGSRDQGQELESDEELSTYPNRRSSHIAGSRHGTRNRGGNGPYREINLSSNDDLESISDSDNDTDRGLGHKKTNRDKWGSNGRNYQRRADNGEFPFDSESNDDDDLPSSRNKMRGRKAEFGRRGSSMVGHDHFESARDVQFRNNGRTNNRRNFFGNGGRDRSSHRNGNGPSHDGYDRKPMDERRGNMRHFGRREAFGPRARGKRDLLHDRSEMGQKTMDGRPRRRVIER